MGGKMKRLSIVFFVFSVLVFAQDEQPGNDVNSTVEALFSVCKDKNYSGASALIVYTGPESSRDYAAPLNPKSAAELDKAERIAKKVKAYLDISDSYEILSVGETTSDEKTLLVANIGFKSGKQILEIDFTFIEVNNNLLLVSID